MKRAVLIAACALCVDWTRLAGTVKRIDLKAQTVTIQNRDGDLLTVPVDYQVKIVEKHGEMRGLRTLALDEKIILTRIPSDQPKDETDGLVPLQPEPSQRGRE